MKTLAEIFSLLLFVFLSHNLVAQDKSIIGKVSNTQGEALSYASVVLFSLPDSLHIAFTATDADGNYRLTCRGEGGAFLQVRYMGYKPQERHLKLETSQVIDFVLEASEETLTGAIVNARMLGAKIRGDTIVYNLGVYTDRTERVLRDILEKLPGIEVDANGKVKAQGRSVKILIDGKEFFLDQSQMATLNLPADMIKSVELINNYNDIGMLSDSSAPQGITVLNIGIKDEFRSRISGVLMGGGGAIDRYAGKANLFNFSKNFSIATLFDANNTGEMAFTFSDYILFQSGMQRLSRNNIGRGLSVSFDASGVPVLAFSDDVARKEGQTGAFNLSYRHPNNKLKLNAYLIANRQEQKGEIISHRRATVDNENVLAFVDGLAEQSKFNFVNAYLSTDYQPSRNFFISNRTMVNGESHSLDMTVSRLIDMRSDTLFSNKKGTLFEFSNYFLSKYQTKDGNLFTFDGYYRYNDRPDDMNIWSDKPFLGLPFSATTATEYRVVQNNKQQLHELSVFLEYAHKIGSFFLKSQTGVNYLDCGYNTLLFQSLNGVEVTFVPQHDYDNTIRYINRDLWAGLWLQRNVGIFRLALGMDAHYFATALNGQDNHSIVQNNRWRVLPNGQLTIYLATNHHIIASVNLAQETRRMNMLNESKVIDDYKSIMQGKAVNNLLNPVFNAFLNYFYSNFHSGTTITANSSYTVHSSPLTSNYTYRSNYTQSTTMESPDNRRLTSSFSLRQSLRFLPVDIRARVTYVLQSFYNYTNGNENNIILHTLRSELAFLTFSKRMLNGELGGSITWNRNQSKLTDRTTRLLTLAPYAKLRANVGKGWSINASVQHYKYDANDMRKDITNLSSSVVYIPPKSKFEFELNADNILNFNKTEKITSMYASSYFEERVIQTLPGFLMAKITYRL